MEANLGEGLDLWVQQATVQGVWAAAVVCRGMAGVLFPHACHADCLLAHACSASVGNALGAVLPSAPNCLHLGLPPCPPGAAPCSAANDGSDKLTIEDLRNFVYKGPTEEEDEEGDE